ncbi:MAG: ABC transporter permease subunit [Ruminococcus sp.]|nr:ABC transporter permease subunit [Ruminococcus sp.]
MVRKILTKPQAVIGLAIMLAVMVCVVFAPLLAPNDPNKPDILNRFAQPSAQYPLGTDDMGRCIASRLIFGARNSMCIALPTIAVIAIISILAAAVCAYAGGLADKVFVIVSNIFMALPPFLVAITLVGLFESKAVSILISIAAAMWVWNAQVVRTYVVREKAKPYIITCRMSGCSEKRIVLRHVIPNIFPHLLVLYSTSLSSIIIMISSYAFLGLGLEAGTAEWGSMLTGAGKLLYSHPMLIVYPGVCILLTAAGFNLFGEALRDICDPKES